MGGRKLILERPVLTDFFQKGQDQEVSDAWVNAKVFIFYGLLEWFS